MRNSEESHIVDQNPFVKVHIRIMNYFREAFEMKLLCFDMQWYKTMFNNGISKLNGIHIDYANNTIIKYTKMYYRWCFINKRSFKATHKKKIPKKLNRAKTTVPYCREKKSHAHILTLIVCVIYKIFIIWFNTQI